MPGFLIFLPMQRDFKGVWIPKEIWLDSSLSIAEKCLIVEIDSLDNDAEKGCFASNEYLCKFLGLSEGRTANMISDLRKRGYIENVFFDGRNRGLRIKSRESSLHENVKAGFTKTLKQPSRKCEHSNTVINTDSNTDINTLSKNENQGSELSLNAPDSEKLFFRALEKVTAHLQMYPDTVQLMRDSAKVTESDFPAEKITDEVKEWIRWNCEDVMFVQEAAKRMQYGKSTFVSWLRIAKEKAAKKSNGYASAKPNNRNSETPDERNQRVASGAIELHNELLIKHGIKPGDYSGGH